MRVGRQLWQRELVLRGGGLFLVSLGLLAVHHLFGIAGEVGRSGSATDFLLAVFGFLSTSAGAGLACMGRHVLDRIDVSERWARREIADLRAPRMPPDARTGPSDRVIFHGAEVR